MKFGYIWPSVSEKKSTESVGGRRTDDGGFPCSFGSGELKTFFVCFLTFQFIS